MKKHGLRQRLDALPYGERQDIIKRARELSQVADSTFYATLNGSADANWCVINALSQITGMTMNDLFNPEQPIKSATHQA